MLNGVRPYPAEQYYAELLLEAKRHRAEARRKQHGKKRRHRVHRAPIEKNTILGMPGNAMTAALDVQYVRRAEHGSPPVGGVLDGDGDVAAAIERGERAVHHAIDARWGGGLDYKIGRLHRIALDRVLHHVGHEYYTDAPVALAYPARNVHAAYAGHLYIEEDKVELAVVARDKRERLAKPLDRILATVRRGMIEQQAFQKLRFLLLILDYGDTRHFHSPDTLCRRRVARRPTVRK